MTHLVALPRFQKAAKKMRPAEKAALHDAIRVVVADPAVGAMKVGDLAGTRVHKYRYQTTLMLLAYSVSEDGGTITLQAIGTHENFYRDLKRD